MDLDPVSGDLLRIYTSALKKVSPKYDSMTVEDVAKAAAAGDSDAQLMSDFHRIFLAVVEREAARRGTTGQAILDRMTRENLNILDIIREGEIED